MKTLSIAFIIFSSLSITNLLKEMTMDATFDGYENGAYYFSNALDTNIIFDFISEEAIKKFDLTSEEFSCQKFKITYSSDAVFDEMENEIVVLTIENLEILLE